MEKYTNASAATWARTICLIVALLNSLLAAFNKSPLPIDNEQLQQLVSTPTPSRARSIKASLTNRPTASSSKI